MQPLQKCKLYHNRSDSANPLAAAEVTCRMLHNCALEVIASDAHFSDQGLDAFMEKVIGPHYAR